MARTVALGAGLDNERYNKLRQDMSVLVGRR
jgi:hypothetical protein